MPEQLSDADLDKFLAQFEKRRSKDRTKADKLLQRTLLYVSLEHLAELKKKVKDQPE
jgi:hypothetical protein